MEYSTPLPRIVAAVMPAPHVPVELRVRAGRVLERHHTAIPWRAIGARTYTLSELNQALADADAMRLPKALVKPN